MHLSDDEPINRVGIQLHQDDELVPLSYMRRARLLSGSRLDPVSQNNSADNQGRAARRDDKTQQEQGYVLEICAAGWV